jgi:hypothetical protein
MRMKISLVGGDEIVWTVEMSRPVVCLIRNAAFEPMSARQSLREEAKAAREGA